MTFPSIASRMIPLISDVADIPDDFDLNYEDDCRYFRVPLAKSEDGQWLAFVDVGYQERTGLPPCNGVRALNYVMLGYEITVIDVYGGPAVYQTMDPRAAKCAIPEECRNLVVEIACHCYFWLPQDCEPDYIYRVTWLPEPNENALKKHTQATERLMQAGFSNAKRWNRRIRL
jgi:hypothetical protein